MLDALIPEEESKISEPQTLHTFDKREIGYSDDFVL